jgi:hypothetical protein
MKKAFLVVILYLTVNLSFSQFVKVETIPINDLSILKNMPVNFDTVYCPQRIYFSHFELLEFYIDNADSITITNQTHYQLQDNVYLLYDSNMACIVSFENLRKTRTSSKYKAINDKIVKGYPDVKEHFFRCTVKKIFINYRTGDTKIIRYNSFYIKHFLKKDKKLQLPNLPSPTYPLKTNKRIIFPNIICYEKDTMLGEYYHRKTKTNQDTVFLFRQFPIKLTDSIWCQYSDSSILLLCLHKLKKQNQMPYKEHITKITKGDIISKKASYFTGKYTFVFMNKNSINFMHQIDETPKSIFFIREKD